MESSSKISMFNIINDNNIEKLIILISEQKDLLYEQFLGDSLLHIAASKGHIQICNKLIEFGLDVNIINADYLTPIIEAAREGHIDVVHLLLDRGAWVDGDPRGMTTPLIEAALRGFLDISRIFIAHHADINRLQVKFNYTALDMAIAYKQNEVVFLLEEHKASKSVETIDLTSVKGSGILSHVYNNVGAILVDEYEVNNVHLKTALIEKGRHNKILFTFGNFNVLPRHEFLICLPYDWPLNKAILNSDYKESFPLKFLSLLSKYNFEENNIKEGSVFEKHDELWEYLPCVIPPKNKRSQK